MELEERNIEITWAAALLHNIGLVGVPSEVLEKDEHELSESERALLRNNPVLSQEILSRIDLLKQVGVVIRSHTEAFDGGGYPDGLKGEEIHIGSMIISVCKAYDRLRHGEKQVSHAEAFARVEAERGGRFSPEVVDALFKLAGDSNCRTKTPGAALNTSPSA